VKSANAVDLEITIFNPALDPDASIARDFVRTIAAGIASHAGT
jgi:hypothetical protein